MLKRVVIIHVEGGNVCGVEQPPDVDVHIIDLDTEGVEEGDLCQCGVGSVVNHPHLHAEYPGEGGEEATNAHEALLAALRLYLKLDNDIRAGCEIDPADWAECYQAAQAAIAKAKGA